MSTKMTVNGVSTTQAGQEQYETFFVGFGKKRKKRVMYDYRTHDGKLFSTVAHSIDECRAKKDEWLKLR